MRWRQGYWILLFFPSLLFGQPLVVTANYRGKILWSVTLEALNGRCYLKNKLNSKSIKLEKKNCSDLKKAMSDVSPTKKTYLPVDEPVFTFTQGQRKFNVAYQPLEICDIQTSGSLLCRKQTLTAAEKILHFLRNNVYKAPSGA